MTVQPSAAQRMAALQGSLVDPNSEEFAAKFKMCLYGTSGVGKTVEAIHLAHLIKEEGKKVLHIDTSEGYISLFNHPQLMKPENYQRMLYKGLSQITDLVEAIQAGAGGFDVYDTLVFDEFSTSAKKFLHVVLDANKLSDSLTKAPEFKEWGIMSRHIEGTIWKLLELKDTHNIFFLAHERWKEDKATKAKSYAPSFMDSIEGPVKENCHVVARMEAEVTNMTGAPVYNRTLQVHPTRIVTAKSRVGELDIKVSPARLNERVVEWLASGGKLVESTGILEDTRVLDSTFAEQDVNFTGFEITESD